MKRTLIVIAALAVALCGLAAANDGPHAEIDCGSLSGVGVVRVIIGDVALRVDVRCGGVGV